MTNNGTTLRYRTFPSKKPLPSNATPHGQSHSSIPFEKEPERDPEADCFMCRQAHVYLKPIGMQQEFRVGGNQPPPLTREEIDELSQKKELTKKEVRLLLQCYFPEIKDVKYFQLHRYHSCCYNPKHLSLCKNHITAIQNDQNHHPGHHHDDNNNDNDNMDPAKQIEKQNRVSFVRIKIEPTKGIPTRFLGPQALPESLAEMLLKQVNRYEDKQKSQSISSTPALQSQSARKAKNSYGLNGNGPKSTKDIDDDNYDTDDKLMSGRSSKTKDSTNKNGTGRKKNKPKHWELLALQQSKQETCNCRHHVTRVEDDQLVHDWCRCKDHQHKDMGDSHQPVGLGEPSPREMRLNINEVAYDWCKCTHHRNAKSNERRKSITLPSLSQNGMRSSNGHNTDTGYDHSDHYHETTIRKRKSGSSPPPPPPPLTLARDETKPVLRSVTHRTEAVQTTPPSQPSARAENRKRRDESKRTTPSITYREESMQTVTPPPPAPPARPTQVSQKRRESATQTQTRTVAVEAREPSSTEIALSYDPSVVDYDVIQEAIYYRTSSGRLIKPQITNSYTYDTEHSAANNNYQAPNSSRDRVIYVTHNGQIPDNDDRRQKKNVERSPSKSVILSNPGSVYRGQAYVNPEHAQMHNGNSNTVPLLKLPTIPASSRQHYNNNNQDQYQHQPAEFTLAKFSHNPADTTPTQRSQANDSDGGWKTVSMSMQKSSKPTFTNSDPTPNFGRQSSVIANRRWFDQPLGDQNLRPVHDSEYGVIATPQSDSNQTKYQNNSQPTKKENNCTIS
ncbi:unnamed protein product [Adineta steineri]|uniref:Uncharacterized protein n=1 Tax=Adineta steineri TaxID=433720 RepID=A0A815C370_9BILA|nr:unnamed protein product [Adineta steineri]